jgi:hypothetical protein
MPNHSHSKFAGPVSRPSAPPAPVPSLPCIDRTDAAGLCREATAIFAASDPIGAVRTLAAALKPQSSGAKLIAVGALIRSLAADEPPAFLASLAAEVARLSNPKPLITASERVI